MLWREPRVCRPEDADSSGVILQPTGLRDLAKCWLGETRGERASSGPLEVDDRGGRNKRRATMCALSLPQGCEQRQRLLARPQSETVHTQSRAHVKGTQTRTRPQTTTQTYHDGTTFIHSFIHTYIHTYRQTDRQTDIHTHVKCAPECTRNTSQP